MSRFYLVGGLCLVLMLCCSPAVAQEMVLEEIVVTAQKRVTSSQDTPVSITAITGDDLSLNNLATMEDVAAIAPGLVVGGNAAFEHAISIRGISSAVAGIGADSPTGIYVDGVYIGRPIGAIFELADIERVEVLRGPQGTLYGRNTVGGAISVVTREPSFATEGFVNVSWSDLEQVRTSLGISGSIIDDKLAGRISVAHNDKEDWVDNSNPTSGRDVAGAASTHYRGALQYNYNDEITATLRMDYGDIDDPLYAKNISAGSLTQPLISNHSRVNLSELLVQEREVYGGSLQINYAPGDFTVTSITGYRNNKHEYQVDTDGTQVRLFRSGQTERQDQLTQEIRLTSRIGSAGEWIAGLYYFNEDSTQDFYVEVIPANLGVGRFSRNETTSYAAFGQLDWGFTDTLTATVGLRYSKEKKEFGLVRQDSVGSVSSAFGVVNKFPRTTPYTLDSEQWSAVTGKLGLAWSLSDELLVFASLAQGFKSGGYNFGADQLQPPFDPEEVLSYEVGVKSDFLNKRMRLNATAFYYDYEDLQVRVGSDIVGVFPIENAATAEIYGAELELSAIPADGLYISATLSLLSAEYEDYVQRFAPGGLICPGGTPGAAGLSCDLSGHKLNRAPEYTFSIAADYTLPLSNGGTLLSRLAYQYEDDVYYTEQNQNELGHRGFETLDAKLSYSSPADTYTVSLYAKNALDEQHYTHVVPIAGFALASGANQPRTIGAEINVRF